jgi:hypothetical protein
MSNETKTPPRKTRMLRLGMLCVACLGTVLWLASFMPVIEHWNDKHANGFQLIPAFYGTIFFAAFVLPLLVMALRGSQQRRPNTAMTLLVVVLVISILFGLPLLVS